MVSEVSTFPSFGLVSPVSNGAHNDMDYYMFLDSAMVLTPFMKQMAIRGYTFYCPLRIFNVIREIGINCEKEMFKTTGGINTHKGMIFLMGICITSVAKSLFDNNKNNIQIIIKQMVINILVDFILKLNENKLILLLSVIIQLLFYWFFS